MLSSCSRLAIAGAGVASLAVAYDFTGFKGRPDYGHRIVRLHIGLENRDDLIADLEQGWTSSMNA